MVGFCIAKRKGDLIHMQTTTHPLRFNDGWKSKMIFKDLLLLFLLGGFVGGHGLEA